MHRDLELVRALLLRIADVQEPGDPVRGEQLALEGFDPVKVAGHLVVMDDQGLIEIKERRYIEQTTHELRSIFVVRIRPDGYDLIDAIKADNVWEGTKRRLSAVGGAASLEIVKQVAAGVAKAILQLP